MRKQYSSSLYSQKSTTSAKSARSFLSLSTSIWPSSKKKSVSIAEKEEEKNSVWENVKRLLVLKKAGMKKDSDSIATRSINTTSSTSSVGKIKQLFLSPNQIFQSQSDKIKVNNASTPPPSYYSTLSEMNMPVDHFPPEKRNPTQSNIPAGILINRGEDSAEAIEERKKRRHKRREYILKLQQRNHGFRRHFYPSSDSRIDPAINYHHHHILFQEEEKAPPESSSLDTLVTNDSLDTVASKDDKDLKIKPRVGFYDEQTDDTKEEWEYNPRIMFIEPSPVPRFRNVAPPPPPSPPYMNIIVDQANLDDHDSKSRKSGYLSIIESPTTEDDQPTIFAPKDIISASNLYSFDDEQDRRMSLLMESLCPRHIKKPHLYFYPPYQRGQTIKFTLQNAIPEDHIILFKFLTSNASKKQKGNSNTNVTNSTTQPERYFVRPSAGRMVSADQTDIILFLNHVPTLRPGELLKDKILVRWAVIQRNTRIEEWVKSLSEATRKNWIDMLAEQWPNQVTIQMTKINIHFV